MECGVCYCNENMVITNCGHKFCINCLTTWRNINNNCPICRTRVVHTLPVKTHKPDRRITRSMTKGEREMKFYNEFRQLIFRDEPPTRKEKIEIINKVMKLCFQNYSLMNPHIYKVIHDVLFKTTNQQYIIANREILKIRLLEIKPYINHSSTIPIIYQGNYEDTEDTALDDAEAIANDDDYYDYDYD